MKASRDLVEKCIKLAGKWRGSTVFGGYVRDILLGQGTLETQLVDLDLHFSKWANLESFAEFLGIFVNLELVTSSSDKYEDSMTKTFIATCLQTGNQLKMDCSCPCSASLSEPEPVRMSGLDFDVNSVFMTIEPGLSNSIKALPMISIVHVIERIKNGRFSCANTPKELSCGKNIVEKKKSEISKAIKIVLRAEKMVKRGWVQDGVSAVAQLDPVMPYWHVTQWFKPENRELMCLPVETDVAWANKKHIVYDNKRCCLCHGDFEPGHTVMIPPCGHAVHVACSDYDPEAGAGIQRQESGIVGWFAKQRSKVCGDSNARCLDCPTCKTSIFAIN